MLQRLRGTFRRQLLTFSESSLREHLQRTVSEYEGVLQRQQNLLELSARTEELRTAVFPADVLQLLTDDIPPDQKKKRRRMVGQRRDQQKVTTTRTRVRPRKTFPNSKAQGKMFRCPICGTERKFRSQLTMHMRKHREEKPYSCSVCEKLFRWKSQLNAHLCDSQEPDKDDTEGSDSDEDSSECDLTCSICEQTFTHRHRLKRHLQLHAAKKAAKCSICQKTFANKGSLNVHMVTHSGQKPFSCSSCGRKFSRKYRLQTHICVRLEDLRADTFMMCFKCKKTFPNKTLLLAHMSIHWEKSHGCSVCGIQFQFKSQLERHMRKHTGEKPYTCNICWKKFTQMGTMREHMVTHGLDSNRFGCEQCGRQFFWLFQKKNHVCSKPRRQRQVKDFTFRFFKKLIDDYESDESNDSDDFWKETRKRPSVVTYQRNKKLTGDRAKDEEKPQNCPTGIKVEAEAENISEQTLKSRSNDLKHKDVSDAEKKRLNNCQTLHQLSTFNEDENLFSCLFCGKGFQTGGKLTAHLSIHMGETLLNCILCEKTFSFESELMDHDCFGENYQSQTVGSMNKLLRCSECGERFLGREDLKSHTCPYTRCSVCNAVFGDRESLLLHMRSHGRQTQFTCSVCDEAFTWRRSLTKHMEVHENEDISSLLARKPSYFSRHSGFAYMREKAFKCSICGAGFRDQETLDEHVKGHIKQKGFSWKQNLMKNMEERESNRIQSDKKSIDEDKWTSENGTESVFGLERAKKSDPDTDDSDFWKETRRPSSVSIKSVLENVAASGTFEPQSDDSVDSDFWKDPKESRRLPVKLDTDRELAVKVKQEEPERSIHVKEEPQEADVTPFSFSPATMKHEDDGAMPQTTWCHGGVKETESSELPVRDPAVSERKTIHNSNRKGSSPSNAGKSYSRTQKGQMHLGEPDQSPVEEQQRRSVQVKEEPQEADISSFSFSSTAVKREDDGEMPQTSQPHQSDTSENSPTKTDDGADSDFWKDASANSEPDSGKKPPSHSDDRNSSSDGELDHSDFWEERAKKRSTLSCKECGKKFLYIAELNLHMRRHTGDKLFYCPICGQECLYKSHLDTHMRTHTGEKPYSCPECGKKFGYKGSMRNHMSLVHSGQKPYSCEVCEQGFDWFTELKYHDCMGELSQRETESCNTAETD